MLATCICLNGSLLDQLSCTIVYLHNLFTCTFGRINMSVCLSVWAGHVRRMPDTRVPKQLLYAELSSGKRKTGGQWKRYKDQLKANLYSHQTHSSNINLFILIIIIILDDSDHHTRSRGIARERERERERVVIAVCMLHCGNIYAYQVTNSMYN